jgi:hypothetical protein
MLPLALLEDVPDVVSAIAFRLERAEIAGPVNLMSPERGSGSRDSGGFEVRLEWR